MMEFGKLLPIKCWYLDNEKGKVNQLDVRNKKDQHNKINHKKQDIR